MKKNNKIEQLDKQYQEWRQAAKLEIKKAPTKRKKFGLWLKYIFINPFKYLIINLRDLTTWIIFIITFLILSSEVWVFYLLGLITGNSWFYGIASAYWLFWLGPFTPFMPLCIAITIFIREILRKWKNKRKK